eukprot:c25505_g1_i1 orf=625-2058(-)
MACRFGELGVSTVCVSSTSPGHGMQSFSSALPSPFIESLDAGTISSEFYGFGKIGHHLSSKRAEEHGVVGVSHTGGGQSMIDILPSANSDRFASGYEQQFSQVSSLSGVSTDSQTAQNTQTNQITHMGFESPSSHHFQSWTENSSRPETSTSMEGDAKDDDQLENGNREMVVVSGSSDHERTAAKPVDSKVLRRLAQNREAARKSRLRKKAYVQQLESSRVKLNQLEQELERARQQGTHVGGFGSGDHSHAGTSRIANPGVAAFDMDYARWVEEQNRQVSELRSALATHVTDNELRVLVDGGMVHYDELFRLKSIAVKADVFHIVSGMWKTPAERCFMWMGGFRPSELLKILIPQIEPLTEQQLLAVCNLQQSSQQAEDALSQGMEALQQNLADTLSAGSLGTPNVANYMGQMAMAMGKLGTLENFVRQADNLRQQTLQQMYRILTTRQAARGLLSMGDYFSRLRALSSLWLARPRD